MTKLLVIGYGNSLRGDDAVGRRLAEAVEAWQAPNITVISLHQLVPELVENLQRATHVIFVDAVVCEGEVQLRRIAAAPENLPLNHYCGPGRLLALAAKLYRRCPSGWLLTIPGTDFDLSEDISPAAQVNVTTAVALVEEFYKATTEHS